MLDSLTLGDEGIALGLVAGDELGAGVEAALDDGLLAAQRAGENANGVHCGDDVWGAGERAGGVDVSGDGVWWDFG